MDDGTNERIDEMTRRTLLAALGGPSVAATAGCSTMLETGSGSRFRVGTLRPPITLDPIGAKSTGSEQVIGKIFDGLYEYGDGTDTVPKIAAGELQFENAGRAAVVELDDSARFQNDRAVVADDVVYSYSAPLEEDAPTAWRVSPFDSVEAVDEHTVRFSLEEPYPGLEHALTRPIVPGRSEKTTGRRSRRSRSEPVRSRSRRSARRRKPRCAAGTTTGASRCPKSIGSRWRSSSSR